MNQSTFVNKSLQWLIVAYVVILGLIIVLTNHGDIVLWFNARHTTSLDVFFKYGTHLGDGLLLGILGLILLFINYHKFLTALIAIAIQTVLVHIFKQWLAAGEPRPKTYFADRIDELNFVEGVRVNGYDSFPSGHTASGFVLAFLLITMVKNDMLKIVLFLMAVMIGLSRVYLLQHFAIDIYIGSVMGILSVFLAWNYMKRHQERPKLQKGLLNR